MPIAQLDDEYHQFSSPYALFFHRSLKVIAILMTCILMVFGSLSMLSLAQEPSSFEINIVPESEYAVAGQPFTYTIVMTNVSQVPVDDVIVMTETPTGTTFIETHRSVDWLFGGLRPGETGVMVWNTLEPIASAQVITFDLVVDVLPEMVNQPLVSQEYTIITKQGGAVIGVAPPITNQVLAVMPTATPTLPPTATATSTPVPPTATHTPTPTTTATPIPTSQPSSRVIDAVTPTPIVASRANTTSEATSLMPVVTLVVIGISILIIGGLGLTWFLKRR